MVWSAEKAHNPLVLRWLTNILRLLLSPIWLAARVIGRPKQSWVRLRVHHRLIELRAEIPWWKRLFGASSRLEEPTVLEDVRRLVRAIVEDPDRKGLLVVLHPLEASWPDCASLRDALLEVRRRGKELVVYLPHGGGDRDVYVASCAGTVLMGPQSRLMLLGAGAESLYFKSLLDRVGVRFDVAAMGAYKTAAERFTRDSMSDAQLEQLDALLRTLQEEQAGTIAEGRGLSGNVQAAASWYEHALFSAEEAQEHGLADGALYEDALPAKLGADGKRPFADAGAYLMWRRDRLLKPWRRPSYIAVIPVRGVIRMDPGSGVGASGRGARLSPLVGSLRRASRDPRAKAVILQIDSPGGSALASDLIHHEVQRLAAHKPVVASFGRAAASGGYYIAVGARRIVAQPTSITGSIGVISGKLIAEELLKRAGIFVQTLRMAPHSDVFSPTRGMDDGEREMLRREGEVFYRAFLRVVAEGRGRSTEEIEPLASGRVWSGRDAHAHGLVDRLGGLGVAADEARELVSELPASERRQLRLRVIQPLPKPAPEPLPPEATPAGALWALIPELEPLLDLARREPSALYYALDLPRLR